MIREVKFESQDRRIKQILAALNENGIKDIEEANAICEQYGLDPYKTCEETQPICFENAKWAYVVGCAIALKKGCKTAAEAAEAIGIGLQSFCIPGSVADDRKVGLGHGNLAARLLREETHCFCFLAGHESFAAAEGAIKIAAKADKVRKEPLRCILNGLGKDAAQIIRVTFEGTEILMKLGKANIDFVKGVCAVFINMLRQEKLAGKTSVKKLLKSGGDLQVYKFETKDLSLVKKLADQYGILYSVLPDLNKSDGMSDRLSS